MKNNDWKEIRFYIFILIIIIGTYYIDNKINPRKNDPYYTNKRYKECIDNIHPFMSEKGFSDEDLKEIEEIFLKEQKACEDLL